MARPVQKSFGCLLGETAKFATNSLLADTEIIAFDSQESMEEKMCAVDPHPSLTFDHQTTIGLQLNDSRWFHRKRRQTR